MVLLIVELERLKSTKEEKVEMVDVGEVTGIHLSLDGV